MVRQDAGYIINQSLPDRTFRGALDINGWDPTDDPQAQAADWFEFDYEYAQTPDVSSQEFTSANFNSTYFGFSQANYFSIDQRGFNTFLHSQASEFLAKDDARLLLKKIVTNITSTDSGVEITNSDGSCIAASYAITTFSLGVLQSDSVTFTPPLPNWKSKAINAFEMGVYTKIFFQFPPEKIFWNTSTEFFLYASPTRGYYPLWQSLDHEDFLPGSGIFFVTIVTDQSRIVDRQSDEETKQQILVTLRQMFGAENVPEPTDFFYPRWSLTPWSYGSYSNWPPGLTVEGHQNLRSNVGRVWFAGEATSAEFYGFLHGAWFEGQRAGELVAGCVKQGGCEALNHYEELGPVTEVGDFVPENGWFTTSFQTIGDVDLESGEVGSG